MQPPRNPPWPSLQPLLVLPSLGPCVLLLAALAAGPHAHAADGFTEIGIDPPDPVPHAVRPALLDEDDPIPPAGSDDAEWAAWWREWRGWTPFATPEADAPPLRDTDPARLGGATMPIPPGPILAFADTAPPYVPGTPARSTAATATPIATIATAGTTATTGATAEEEEAITLIGIVPPALLAEPPPVPSAPVIGEPASMALLGGALAALGLLRRRRPAG